MSAIRLGNSYNSLALTRRVNLRANLWEMPSSHNCDQEFQGALLSNQQHHDNEINVQTGPADRKARLRLPRLCLFNRHTPKNAEVVWDGTHYVGTCSRCERSIRRLRHHVWLNDWHK